MASSCRFSCHTYALRPVKNSPAQQGPCGLVRCFRCQQANEQRCLPNGSVVQHAGLLKQHLIRGCESLFRERLIVLFCIFSFLIFHVASGLCVIVKVLHIHITGRSERRWAEPGTCSASPQIQTSTLSSWVCVQSSVLTLGNWLYPTWFCSQDASRHS